MCIYRYATLVAENKNVLLRDPVIGYKGFIQSYAFDSNKAFLASPYQNLIWTRLQQTIENPEDFGFRLAPFSSGWKKYLRPYGFYGYKYMTPARFYETTARVAFYGHVLEFKDPRGFMATKCKILEIIHAHPRDLPLLQRAYPNLPISSGRKR